MSLMPSTAAATHAVRAFLSSLNTASRTARTDVRHASRLPWALVAALAANVVWPLWTSAQTVPVVTASATDGLFEDKVVVSWTTDNIPPGAYMLVTRIDLEPCLLGDLAGGDTLAVRSRFDTEYSDFTGDPGVTYCYDVAAKDGQGNTLAESIDDGSKVIFRPTNLRATDGTEEDRVLVSWADRSEVETRYEIGRGLEEDFLQGLPLTVLADLPENSASYSDMTAVPGTSYYYCATAYDAAGFASQQVCDLGVRGFVTPPRNVSASDGQWPDFVRITWTDASEAESFFTIYRDDNAGNVDSVASVPANTTHFDDPWEGQLADNDGLDNDGDGIIDEPGERVAVQYNYCVTATAAGMESVQVCDLGIRGILPTPENVAATVDTFDDRVVLTWEDVTDTEDGFQIFRTIPSAPDSMLLGNVRESVQTFTDRTPLQDQDYRYCVRAFSAVATPDTTYSPSVCATGRRTTVLAPTNVAATDNAFEERINLTWSNPATTAMFFNIYRDDVLIDNVSVSTPLFTDFDAPSNRDLNYCVTAVSVRGAAVSQEVATNLLETAKLDAARVTSSVETTESLASVVFGSVSDQLAEMAFSSESSDIVETAKVCNDGSRKLAAPTSLSATYDEFEDHVQLSWTDNSKAERGYVIYRGPSSPLDTTTPWTAVDTVSAGRTSYGDYAGAPGMEYGYRVQAYDMRGAAFGGGLSDPATDTGLRRLEPPTAVQASDGTSETEVRVTWIDNSRAESGYYIFQDGIPIDTVGANATSVVVLGAPLNQVQAYEVRAFDAYGTSEPESDDGGTALLPPGDVKASDVYSDKVVVVWTDSSEVEEGYSVSRDGLILTPPITDATTFVDDTPDALRPGVHLYCVQTLKSGLAAESCDEGRLLSPEQTGALSSIDASIVLKTSVGNPLANLPFASVSISGINAGASALNGVFFYRAATSGEDWNEVTTPGSPNPVTLSPATVSVGQDYAVAEYQQTISGGGKVEVYKRDGSEWSLKDQFLPTGDEQFLSTDLEGDVFVVGSSGPLSGPPPTYAGAAHVYRKNRGSGSAPFVFETTLLPSDRTQGDYFGGSVAVSGNTAIVSAVPNGRAGKIYFFEYVNSAWVQQGSPLFASDSAADDGFGAYVAIDGDYAIVERSPASFSPLAAGAYIFSRNPQTGVWSEQQKLARSDSGPLGSKIAGRTVAISGRYAVVGAPSDDSQGTGTGSTIVFRREDNGWVDIAKLEASVQGGATPEQGSNFGWSVDIDADNIIVGAPGTVAGLGFIQPLVIQPELVGASDGSFEDRIQLTWTDPGRNEERFNVYRRNSDGALELIGTSSANVEVYDDFSAVPGAAYEYCVTSFNSTIAAGSSQLGESLLTCDIGWRPANGTISGQVSALADLQTSAQSVSQEAGTAEPGTAAIGTTELASKALLNNTQPQSSVGTVTDRAVDLCLDPNPNQALRFDGVGGYVSVEHIDRPTQMTVCGWIKTTVPGEGMQVLSWANDQTGDLVFWQVFGGTLFYGQVGTGNFSQLGSAVPVNNGQWVHACVVRDGDNASMYLNGEPSGSAAGFGFPLETNTLTIGGFKNSSGVSGFFNGAIDEIQIWNVALDGAAINDNMSTKLTGNEAGLIGYWPFDQGQGRVAPDLSATSAHGKLRNGAHWLQGPPVGECTRSDNSGNYTVTGIRYADRKTFTVTPIAPPRSFTPASKEITLSVDSPVENQVDFIDNSQFGISGAISFEGTECPAADMEILVDGENRTSTASDGSYSVSVFPSGDATDLRRVEPRRSSPQNSADVTLFQPRRQDLFVRDDVSGVDFVNTKKRTFRGYYGGSCSAAGDLGTATVRVFTENGCFEREYTGVRGDFELELPPQKYLVQVTPEAQTTPPDLVADMITYFDDLGARELDLTTADDTLDFIFRPNIAVEILGLPAPPAQCSTGYTADGRQIPLVPIVAAGQTLPLTIKVSEDYGARGSCPVTDGTVQIFDAIADSSSVPKSLAIKDGQVSYNSVGASPNIFSGAFIEGSDRSFQKSITAVASVEGKESVTATEWAIVEGIRPRTASFVSATTGELPLIVLHDPPGSDSYSYIEEGTTTCNTWSDMSLISSGGGVDLDFVIGFKTGGQLGFLVTLKIPDAGGGLAIRTRLLAGGETEKSNALEICVSNEKRLSTKGDNTWVGEDLFLGVALNLVFAAADVLTVDKNMCSVDLDETLAGDLDDNKPFETTYAFGETHIRSSLIPELRLLSDLVGENTEIGGEIQKEKRRESIGRAIDNWEKILDDNEKAIRTGVDSLFVENRSFSAGAEYEYSTTSTRDSTWSTGTSTFVDFEAGVGAVLTLGYDQTFLAINETHFRTTHADDSTNGSSKKIGYVLSDGDTGDFFSVDVGEDPRYPGVPVFKTVAGRSSNPWEENTQRRDWPILDIFPPVKRNLPPDEPTAFTMTLTNASESKERREYTVHIVKQQNPGSAFMSFTGDPIDGDLFLVEGGESQEITLQVERGPNRYAYENLALIAYPDKEYEIWQADTRQPFVMGDTAFFSVYFDAPCSDISIVRPKNLWRLNAASWGDSLDVILGGFDLGGSDAFNVERIGLQYRLTGSSDWLPAVAIPIGVPGTPHSDSLGADASSWFTRWQPPREGTYEIRAFSECTNDRLFSDVVTGSVDTKPPKSVGPPLPSDEVLALGSAISATFNEPIDCESISTSGAFQNTKLRFVTGPSMTEPGEPGIGGLDAVCNGETVVIEPPDTFDWNAAEGQIMEARFVSGLVDAQGKSQVIEDLAGNPIANDIAWQFTVRRSAFTWSPADLTVDVDLGSDASFDAQLVNGRVRLVEYALNGVPAWLSVTPSEGTVAPADASPVSFLVSDTLAIGQYTATILAENDALPATLNLTVDVSCPSPGWDLNPSRFSYSMDLTALLSMDGIPSADTADRLGAFVGDELRGTGTANASGIVRMTIYSPLPAGETVTFQALDASACRLYPATDLILPFVNGRSEGDTGNPIAINAMNVAPQQSVALSKGWTWFSINRTPSSTDPDDVLATLAPANSDVLKSQTAFSLFDGATRNWIGALNEVVPGKGYMVKLSGPNSLVVSGAPVDVLLSPIDVTPGWNWIGYHPQGSQPVNDALASLTANDVSDLIKSQYGFAQWDGSAWIGSLTRMDPGLGYMIKRANAGTIVYPDVPAGPAVRVATKRPPATDAALARLSKEARAGEKAHEELPGDEADDDLSFKRTSQTGGHAEERGVGDARDFKRAPYNMTVTAEVQIDDQPANRPVFVGAFVDDEPRGLARATYVESLSAYRVFLMVYSDTPDGETVTFRILDEETDRFYDLSQTAPFEADAIIGTPAEPVVLDNRASGKLVQAEELPTEFALRQNYPNPFNPTTTIKYDVPSPSEVRIVLYDVLGRVVRRLVDGNRKAGRYEIVFDAGQIASGTYFYRMQAGDFQAIHKMIVIK